MPFRTGFFPPKWEKIYETKKDLLMKMFPKLFSAGGIGSLGLANRVIKSPMYTGMSGVDGVVTDRLVGHYHRQASGGVSMVVVECAFIDGFGAKTMQCHPGISNDGFIPGLTRLAKSIREAGAVPAIQIGYTYCPKLSDVGAELKDIVSAFGNAAARAKSSGFDLVEICGFDGQGMEGAFSEILADIRAKAGAEYSVAAFISGVESKTGEGFAEKAVGLSKALEVHGADALRIVGDGFAAKVKEAVGIPVIASDSVCRPETAEDVILSGKGDFVSLGRLLRADHRWVAKAANGCPEDIRPCICCNENCVDGSYVPFKYQVVTCTVNPVIGRENELEITSAEVKRNIAVAGGDIAGFEVARVLKLRGHDVTVYENGFSGERIFEAVPPDIRVGVEALWNYMVTAVKKLDIPVMDEEVSADILSGYDAVVAWATDGQVYSEHITKTGDSICASAAPFEIVENAVRTHSGGREANKGETPGQEGAKRDTALSPAKIMDAVHTAYRLALKL